MLVFVNTEISTFSKIIFLCVIFIPSGSLMRRGEIGKF